MLKARFMLEEPAETQWTMKITMSAKDWDSLRDALMGLEVPHYTPAKELQSKITDLLVQARKTLYAKDDDA